MREATILSVSAYFVLIAASCGTDTAAGGNTTLTPTTTETYCDAACDQEVACDPLANRVDCIDGCMEDGTFTRGSVFVDVYSCLADLPCGASDDLCDPTSIDPLPIHDDYQVACVATLTDCGEETDVVGELCGTDGGGDMAEMLPLLGTDVTQSLLDCLQSPCADIPDCLDDVVDL